MHLKTFGRGATDIGVSKWRMDTVQYNKCNEIEIEI
jgi:hypothetical protein